MRDVSSAIDLSLENLTTFGNLHFTPRQLYYEVCRTMKQPKGLNALPAAAVFAAAALPALGLATRKTKTAVALFAANALVTGGLVWLRRAQQMRTPPMPFNSFASALANYWRHRQRPFGLLGGGFDQNAALNSYPLDLALYGLPRLLVCQSAEIAQMLLANNFHLEASCAVVHLGQTAPLSEIFREMLAYAPQACVYFLHDASLTAYSQLLDLRERLDLPANVRLQILGLRPVHAERLHLFAQQGEFVPNVPIERLTFLSDDEKLWLAAGGRAEVAAVNPVRLMRVLRRLVLGLPTTQSTWKLSLPPRELGFMS
ncbi:MAG: hypothetical protein ABI954_10895 [Pyrinomonadaceae bacterium]